MECTFVAGRGIGARREGRPETEKDDICAARHCILPRAVRGELKKCDAGGGETQVGIKLVEKTKAQRGGQECLASTPGALFRGLISARLCVPCDWTAIGARVQRHAA